jgi:hypothetical protein
VQNTGRIASVAEVNSGTNISSGLGFWTGTVGVINERMRISYDGKVLIGDSSSHTSDFLQIETPGEGGGHGIQIRRNDANDDQQIGHILFGNNTDTDLAKIASKTDDAGSSFTDCANLTFSTQPHSGSVTERMRIDSAGNVGVGSKDQASLYDMHATANSTFQVDGPVMSGRSSGVASVGPRNTRDWFVYAGPSANSAGDYVHMKTSLWAGGSPYGNGAYTMSHFRYHSYYAYSTSNSNDATYAGAGSVGWHNWSGTAFYQIKVNDYSWDLVQSTYTSADGYIVLVAKIHAGYAQFSIDWNQWAGYPFREAKVTASSQTNSATGAY